MGSSKMNEQILRSFFLTSLSIVILCLFSGMSRQGHINTWQTIFGFTCEPGNTLAESSLRRLYDTFSDAIDIDSEKVLSKIKEVTKSEEGSQIFSWGNYGHAIFFHWAFNDSPKEHKPLRIQLKRCRMSESGYKTCLRLVEEEWEKRKEKCLREVEHCLGVDKEIAAAIATLLHDIHILADYAENERTAALAPIKELQRDFMTFGLQVLAKDNAQNESDIQKVKDVGTSLNNKVVARNLLSNLSLYTPKCLSERCSETLMKQGIIVQIK